MLLIRGTKNSRLTDYLFRSFYGCRRGEEIRKYFERLLERVVSRD